MPLCCAPSIKESTSTRFIYCCILTVVSVLSVIFHTGGIAHKTARHMVGELLLLIFQLGDVVVDLCGRFQTRDECIRFVGFLAVYRFCVPLAIFHLIFMLLTVRSSDSQSWRGKIHNGYDDLLKLLIVLGFGFGRPLSSLGCGFFLYSSLLWTKQLSVSIRLTHKWYCLLVWMLLAVLGGIAFIFLQNLFLIGFAYEFNGTWWVLSSIYFSNSRSC